MLPLLWPRWAVRHWRLLALAFLAAVLTAGCASAAGPSSSLSRFLGQRLSWRECGQFQCASLLVPLDYAHPDGQTIKLAVIRAPATDPTHRIGSLITNPGGPGASGVDFLRQSYPSAPNQPSNFGAAVRADFDIVSFDPRGVGRSVPVTCLSGPQLDQFYALDTSPTTPARINSLVAGYQEFDSGCQARSGQLLPFVGTPNSARDLDILRAALGDQKISYLGYSYGTYLGAIYTQLFPDHVGRMVLDGPLPPDLTTRQADLEQARGFQDELNRFIADCVTHPDCPLGNDPSAATGKLAALFNSAQSHPIPTGTPRGLDEALAQTGVASALYGSPTSWPQLRDALAGAMAGRGRPLLTLADQYNERHPGGHYSNGSEANVAINCLDHPDPVRGVPDVEAELPTYEQASPLLGASDAWAELQCAYWPVPAQSQPHQVHYAGNPPILVVGNTHDPATPYIGAQGMARQLGSAVLLTYNSDGHTAYGRGSGCIDNTVDTYLTQGTAPPPGTVCQPNAS